MTTEEFIADAAARGWSKTQTLEALNVSRRSFYAMLEVMPALPWPAQGKSLGNRLSNEARRGHFSPALQAAAAAGTARRKELCSHVVDGVRGTIEDHAKSCGVSASTVRRRMDAGKSLKEALTMPATPRCLRRKGLGSQEQAA